MPPARGADGILITRPPEAAPDTARRLAALGWRPVFAPVAEIEPLATELPPPDALQAILATSANALPMLPSAYRGLPLLAVGDATAARARALGFTATDSAGGDAAALAALVLRHCTPEGGALLHVCARNAPDLLATLLAQSGFEVLRREVYAPRPAARLPDTARDELQRRSSAAALFFSPATARTFVALFRQEMEAASVAEMIAIAISDAAAEALAPLPWRRIRVASKPNQDELLAQLP